MKRSASAIWEGDLKTGKGRISTASGVLSDTQYSFTTRFENGAGTNPEELIAAAHAGCFSMALSAQLGNAGLTAALIRTSAAITMERDNAGWTVTASHLDVTARIPGCISGCIPNSRPKRKGRLPHFTAAECQDHDGCQARELVPSLSRALGDVTARDSG
jgi:osmotically inducible protein OsmC